MLKLGILAALLVCIAACSQAPTPTPMPVVQTVQPVPTATPIPEPTPTADMFLSPILAEELYSIFENDAVAAMSAYQGKDVEVFGKMAGYFETENNLPALQLKTNSEWSINCVGTLPDMDLFQFVNELASFSSSWLPIRVKGVVEDMSWNVNLKDCVPLVDLPKPTPTPVVSLEIISFRCYEDNNYLITEGEVKNSTNSLLENVLAVVTWRTVDDVFVTSDDALIRYDPLMPGQTSTFKIMTRKNPLMKVCGLSFQHLLSREFIPSRRN